jgi:hypothetical protein
MCGRLIVALFAGLLLGNWAFFIAKLFMGGASGMFLVRRNRSLPFSLLIHAYSSASLYCVRCALCTAR